MPSKFMYVLACTGISFLYKVEYPYVYTAHIFLPPTHVPAVTCIVPALGTVKDGAMWLSMSMLLALWELVFYALGAKIQKWNRWITQSHPILVYTLVGDHDRMVFIFIFICLGLEEHLGQKDFIIKQGMALPGQSWICDSEGHCMGQLLKINIIHGELCPMNYMWDSPLVRRAQELWNEEQEGKRDRKQALSHQEEFLRRALPRETV